MKRKNSYICKKPKCNNKISRQAALYGKRSCQKCAGKIQSKKMLGKNNPNYTDGRYNKKYHCKGCSTRIAYTTYFYGKARCLECYSNSRKGKNHSRWNPDIHKTYYCIESDCNNEICYQTISIGQGRCKSCAQVGENSSNWNNGSSFAPYALGWNKIIKARIRKRDNYTCQVCGVTEKEHLIIIGKKLFIHHIDYNKMNIMPENLISLCNSCHTKTNYNRDYWFAYFCYYLKIEPENFIKGGKNVR